MGGVVAPKIVVGDGAEWRGIVHGRRQILRRGAAASPPDQRPLDLRKPTASTSTPS